MKIKLIGLFLAVGAGSFFYGCGAEETATTAPPVEKPAPPVAASKPEPTETPAVNTEKARKIESLIELMEGDDEKAAVDAALQLAQVGDETAVEPLLDLAERESGLLRVAALKALGSIGDRRAFDILLEALGDRSVDVRRVAASRLGGFRDEAAIEPLIEALRDEDNWVRIDALYSLQKITNQDFEDYNAWSEWNLGR